MSPARQLQNISFTVVRTAETDQRKAFGGGSFFRFLVVFVKGTSNRPLMIASAEYFFLFCGKTQRPFFPLAPKGAIVDDLPSNDIAERAIVSQTKTRTVTKQRGPFLMS